MKRYGLKHVCILLLAIVGTVCSSPALAAISFVGGALPGAGGGEVSAGAGRGFQATIPTNGALTAMTVSRPTGIQVGDALVAQFIVRPQGTSITSPSGWNLLRRTTQTSGGNNTPPCGLDIISYFRIVQAGDLGVTSDTWYISYPFSTSGWVPTATCTSTTSQNTVAIGGMLAFRGQFPLSPVYYSGDDAVNNGASITHFAPTINVGVTNTMIVAGIGFLNSQPFGTASKTGGVEPATVPATGLNQWACPATTCAAGAQERVGNDVGLSLQMDYFNQGLTGLTGQVNATASGAADNGVGHMVAISEVSSPIDLAITKTAVVSTTPAQVVYTITATNHGSQPEPGPITVIDTLTPELTYVSGTGTNWSCTRALQTITCTRTGALAVGIPSAPLTITTSYTAAGVVTNCASLTGQYGDANFTDNTACRSDAIGGAIVYSGTVYNDANRDSGLTTGETGIGQNLFVKVTTRTGSTCNSPAAKVITTDAVTGAYAFNVAPGNYCLILSTNNNLSDITATLPASFIRTEQPTGINNTFIAAGTAQSTLNFGLYQPANIKVIKALSPVSDTGKFNLAVSGGSPSVPAGSFNPAVDVVNNGTTNYIYVSRAADITVQETAGTGTNLSSYATTLSCTTGDGTTPVSLTSSDLTNGVTRSGTFTAPAAGLTGVQSQVICTFTNTAYVYDYGDAPSGGTLVDTVARNYGSAAHVVPASPAVYLGTTLPDSDTAANQTAWQAQSTALGDNSTGTADEGTAQLLSGAPAAFPALSAGDTAYSLTLVCAGNGATVAGWIDFNKNGTFDAGERTSGTCSSNSVTLNWSGLSGLKTGATFARFRIASVAGEVASPTGVASDGEVEDYAIAIRPGVKIMKSLVPALDAGKFDITVSGGNPAAPAGSSNPAANVGNAGSTGFIAVDAAGTITVQETGNAGAGTSLSNYTTALSCTLGDGTTPVVLSASDLTNGTTRSGSFTAPASNSTGTAAQVLCTFTNTIIAVGVNVTGQVYADTNHNGVLDGGEPSTLQAPYIKLISVSCSGTFSQAVAVVPATGAYTLPSVAAGTYCLLLSTNNNADTTAGTPAGWLGIEGAGGKLFSVASAPVSGLNFGLYNGSRVTGNVFSDIGTGGGGTANDGLRNGTESGLAAVTVKANNGATVYDSATTNGDGDYTLWIPAAAGTVTISESNPSSYLSTGGSPAGSYDRGTDAFSLIASAGSGYSGFNFGDVPDNRFQTDNTASALPGSVVFHPHNFIAGSGGSVTFSTSALATPAVAGWSEVVFRDSNCNGVFDGGEPQISGALALAASEQLCILVKEFVPANAPVGGSNLVTVTASFAYVNAAPALSRTHTRTDNTKVGTSTAAGLTLVKSVDVATALPGKDLTYTIVYGNNSSGPLGNIVIHDSVPAFTQAPSACCVNPVAVCLDTAQTAFPASITDCSASISGSSILWNLTGTLAPGASGQVKFRVTVQP